MRLRKLKHSQSYFCLLYHKTLNLLDIHILLCWFDSLLSPYALFSSAKASDSSGEISNSSLTNLFICFSLRISAFF